MAFIAGRDFMLEGGRSSLRLSFASVPAEQIGEGVGADRHGAGRASGREPGLIAGRPIPRTFYSGVTCR